MRLRRCVSIATALAGLLLITSCGDDGASVAAGVDGERPMTQRGSLVVDRDVYDSSGRHVATLAGRPERTLGSLTPIVAATADGSRIAYTESSGDRFSVHVEELGVTSLVIDDAALPAVSDDGRVAYVKLDEPTTPGVLVGRVTVMDAAHTESTWSDVGRWAVIAWAGDTVIASNIRGEGESELYLLRADGATKVGDGAGFLAVSPNGAAIAAADLDERGNAVITIYEVSDASRRTSATLSGVIGIQPPAAWSGETFLASVVTATSPGFALLDVRNDHLQLDHVVEVDGAVTPTPFEPVMGPGDDEFAAWSIDAVAGEAGDLRYVQLRCDRTGRCTNEPIVDGARVIGVVR